MPTLEITDMERKKGGPQKGYKKPKVDWLTVRKKYIEDVTVTYDDLAKLFGIDANTVAVHGKKEQWVELRQKTVATAAARLEDNVADELAKINDRHGMIWRNAQALIVGRINIEYAKQQYATEQAIEAGRYTKTGQPIVDTRELMGGQQLSYLMTAGKTAVDGERVVRGLPTNVTQTQNDININNPYEKYTPEELEQVLSATEAKLREKYAQNAKTIEGN